MAAYHHASRAPFVVSRPEPRPTCAFRPTWLSSWKIPFCLVLALRRSSKEDAVGSIDVERAYYFTFGSSPASQSQWWRCSSTSRVYCRALSSTCCLLAVCAVSSLFVPSARILKNWIFWVWYLLVLVWYLFLRHVRWSLCLAASLSYCTVIGILSLFLRTPLLALCTMMLGLQSRSTTTSSTSSVAWMVLLAAASVAGCAAALAVVSSSSGHGQPNKKRNAEESSPSSSSSGRHLAIAFCGNSMLYFNDTPRLVQQMVEHALQIAQQQQQQQGNHNCSSSSAAGLLSARRSLAAVAVGTGQRHVQEICHGAGRTGGWRRK